MAMVKPFQHWLRNVPLSDPLQREQATLLQGFLFILIAATILGSLTSLAASSAIDRLLGVGSSLLLGVLLCCAVVVLRQGHFTLAVAIVVVSLIALAAANMLPTGLEGSRAIFTLLALPIVLAGLISGGRMIMLAFVLSVLAVAGVTLGEIALPTWIGYSTQAYDPILTCVTFVIAAGVLALLVGRFGRTLQVALHDSHSREQELERLRASLETTVTDRTAALEQALAAVEQREATLTQTLADLHTSEAAVRELSAPVIPVLPGVLVAPLIGAIDSARADVLADNLLHMIEHTRAQRVIFDITGVPLVDTQVAQVLVQTTAAARLLGAESLLVGIRPEVAQTIVTLGIDFAAIATYPTLQEAVMALLAWGNGHPGRAPLM
ncbi:MAG TPA: STAS domain-containing protein [Roseiflexaceae bacterium]|nr:STAS domain-containing protein [Roseiflexaceae bacterium]